jgi:sarcosine oxidase subunit gamma
MTDSPQRRHGLESQLVAMKEDRKAAVDIRLRHDLGHLNLRGNPGDDEFMADAEAVLGQLLPTEANTFTEDEQRVYWLGPDEWLVLAQAAETGALREELEQSLESVHAAVNDQSGGQIAIRISGGDVRELLAKGCTLDFHPGAFRPGMCAQSGLAKASVLIGCLDDDRFEIVVRRSFSDYLLRWMNHAADEYGVNTSAVRPSD